MGVIFLVFEDRVKILAVGGGFKILAYFRRALVELHTLSTLLGAELHLCFLDREAYNSFRRNDIPFLEGNILGRSAVSN